MYIYILVFLTLHHITNHTHVKFTYYLLECIIDDVLYNIIIILLGMEIWYKIVQNLQWVYVEKLRTLVLLVGPMHMYSIVL